MEQLEFDFDKQPFKYLTDDEIFIDIVSRLTPEDKETLKNTEEDDVVRFHHGYGTWLRNHYGLWHEENPYTDNKDARGDRFPDQVSQAIIERVWMHVTGKSRTFRTDIVDHEDGSMEVKKVLLDKDGKDIEGKDGGVAIVRAFK